MRPNFFILGAPKCGTTSLANWLSQHPSIFVSPIKEPHYFNDDSPYRDFHTEENYLSLFKTVGPQHAAVGEASIFYLFSKTAVPNIETFTGSTARYIVCLRNPVDMCISLHNQYIVSGLETESDLEAAWDLQDSRKQKGPSPFTKRFWEILQYKESCALGQQVERLLKHVERNRIKFIFIEDLSNRPDKVMRETLDFLGVDPDTSSLSLEKQNARAGLKYPALSNLVIMIGEVKRKLGIKKGFRLLKAVQTFNRTDGTPPVVSENLRRRLYDAFLPEIERLETALGTELTHWKLK